MRYVDRHGRATGDLLRGVVWGTFDAVVPSFFPRPTMPTGEHKDFYIGAESAMLATGIVEAKAGISYVPGGGTLLGLGEDTLE